MKIVKQILNKEKAGFDILEIEIAKVWQHMLKIHEEIKTHKQSRKTPE